MHQAGIGAEPAGKVVDRFIAPHGLGEPFSAIFPRCVFGELAFVVGLKRDAFGIHSGEIVPDLPAHRCRHKRSARFHSGNLPDLLAILLLETALVLVFALAGLRRAEVEREVIVMRTYVHSLRAAEFKCALSGIGESAPIRDK